MMKTKGKKQLDGGKVEAILDAKLEKKQRKLHRRLRFSYKKAVPWILVFAIALFLYYFSSTQIFDPSSLKVDFETAAPWLLLFGLSLICFILANVRLGGTGIGSISAIFSVLFKRRLKAMRHYVSPSVNANSRKLRGMIGILLAMSTLVMGLVVMHASIMRGNNAANRSYIGGDIAVYNPLLHESELESMEGIEGVDKVAMYMYFSMDTWKFGLGNELSKYVVNTVDGYGGKSNNWTENVNIVVVNVDDYINMNPQTSMFQNEFHDNIQGTYSITAPNPFENPSSFIDRLREPGTVIMQDTFAGKLGKSVGESVDVSMIGFNGDMEIVGTAKNVPAVAFMKFMDNDDLNVSHGSMLISKETFASFIDDFVGDVDIVIKNMSVPTEYGNETLPVEAMGYTSGFITEDQRDIINPAINGIEGVQNISWRFSTFAPGVPFVNATFNESRVLQMHPNSTINQTETFQLPNRFYIVDGSDEILMAGSQEKILEAHPRFDLNYTGNSSLGWTFGPRNSTASEVLYIIDTLGAYRSEFSDNALCVVNKYVAMYEDVDNQTWVYEMNVDDELVFEFPDPNNNSNSELFNFTVVATLDNHLSYYHENNTEREGFKFSSRSLNYDFQKDGEKINGTFLELFDLDANVILTTYGELSYIHGYLGSLFLDDMVNHAYISVEDGYNVSEVVQGIKDAINADALNYSVFPYKETFIDRATNVGIVTFDVSQGYTEQQAIASIKAWYEENGYIWKDSSVSSIEKINLNSDLPILTPIFSVFFTISIFSLLVAVIGLCTLKYANIKQRQREYGIEKALGYPGSTIRDFISVETIAVTVIGVFFGVLSGVVMTWILFNAISSTVLIPLVFTIPIWQTMSVLSVLIVSSLVASYAMSSGVLKKSSAEIIRYE